MICHLNHTMFLISFIVSEKHLKIKINFMKIKEIKKRKEKRYREYRNQIYLRE